MRYGLRSSQRMTIDEEMTTLLKGMDHDQKRLRGILATYREKRGSEANDAELDERTDVAELISECKSRFERLYRDQTTRFEESKAGQKRDGGPNKPSVDLDAYLNKVSKKLESLEKQNLLNADSTDQQYGANFGLLSHVYLPATSNNPYSISGGSGSADNELGSSQTISNQYEPKVRLQHSYFLATMLNFRSTPHFCCDVCMLLAAITFFFGGMQVLREKGKLGNYHEPWVVDGEYWY